MERKKAVWALLISNYFYLYMCFERVFSTNAESIIEDKLNELKIQTDGK